MVEITESKMVFGPYENDTVYHIEKSNLHNSICSGIKTVEFILYSKPKTLWFIEAKSSSPRPDKNSNEDFDIFIDDIVSKFIHSFNLFLAASLGRYQKYNDIPMQFMSTKYNDISLKFILVIKGHKIEWLAPLNDALGKKLSYHNKIWESSIAVINDELAIKYKLVDHIVT